MRGELFWIRLGAILLTLSGAVENAAAQSEHSAGREGWKRKWEGTVEAAKREGQVSVYIGG